MSIFYLIGLVLFLIFYTSYIHGRFAGTRSHTNEQGKKMQICIFNFGEREIELLIESWSFSSIIIIIFFYKFFMLLRVGDLHYCLNGSTLNYELAISKPYILDCWLHFYLFQANYHWDFLIHVWPFLVPELRWSSVHLIFLNGPLLNIFFEIIHGWIIRKYLVYFDFTEFNLLRVANWFGTDFVFVFLTFFPKHHRVLAELWLKFTQPRLHLFFKSMISSLIV